MTPAGHGVQATSDFAYVACSGDRQIWVLRLDGATARPEVVQKADMPAPEGTTGGVGTPMAFSPDGFHAYLAMRVPPFRLLCYRRHPFTGTLTFHGESRLPGSTPFLNVDRAGKYLFSASNPGGIVAVNEIRADGSVAWPAVQVLHTGHKSHCVAVSPDNRFIYATSTDDGFVHQWRLGGASTPLAPLEPGWLQTRPFADVRHMAFSRDGRLLYLSTEDHGTVIVMAADSQSGTLAEVNRLPLLATDDDAHAADIQLTPDGRFLYVSERGINAIVAFRIGPGADLTRIGSFPTTVRPRSFAINPAGTLMLAAGQDANSVQCHSIDGSSGSLGEGFELQVGRTPTWVSIFAARGDW